MSALLLVPFVVQAGAMLVDEAVHHRRRGLPRWERIGHPLDTLTTAACWAWLLVASPSRGTALVYAALAAFSCLFVTKDERVHATACSAAEHWTHALLFVIHPVVLAIPAWLWWSHAPATRPFVTALLVATVTFATYQTLYWNRPWQRAA